MRYRFVNGLPTKSQEPMVPKKDTTLRFGYFYNQQQLVVLQCLNNYNLEI